MSHPDLSSLVAAALSPEEWRARAIRRTDRGTYEADLIALGDDGRTLRLASEADGELVIVADTERHALAAMALNGHPAGFTHEDVEDETDVAGYCEAMARQSAEAGNEAQAVTFRMLAQRHRLRAAKIAALLPPKE